MYNFLVTFGRLVALVLVASEPAWADKKESQLNTVDSSLSTHQSRGSKIPQLSEVGLPLTSAQMLVQSQQEQANPPSQGAEQAGAILITGVKANPTDKGVEVILQTTQGDKLQVVNRSTGNNFIADISGGQLRLPSGEAFTFRSEKPLAGVTEITVTNVDAITVRVTVVGETSQPTVELFDDDAGLIFGVASAATATQPQPEAPQTTEKPATEAPREEPAAQQDDPIELVVTGEQDGYRAPDASTATRTDTPLRDVPQSIQVVPQQVLKDQQVNTLNEALQNVSGVISTGANYSQFNSFTIRGFEATDFGGNYLRNGLSDRFGGRSTNFSNIERIEILRGPASVLFGGGSPGGTINIVTKQPLRDPFYSVEAAIGSYDFYRGAIDLSGPLDDSKTALYRLNASYEKAGSFVDFNDRENSYIAPTLSVAIGKNTTLTLDGEYNKINQSYFNGVPAVGTVLPNPNGKIPSNRNIGQPDGVYSPEVVRVGYNLEHKFSEDWLLRNAFYYSHLYLRNRNSYFTASLDPDQRTIQRGVQDADDRYQTYDLSTNIMGKFSTGSIKHQLLFGVDLNRYDQYQSEYEGRTGTPLDLFAPNYRSDRFEVIFSGNEATLTDSLGVYIQNQVAFAENFKLLLGGRFDIFEQTRTDRVSNTEQFQSGNAFSPRVGIVYQPIPPISLYASYSKSFTPTIGRAVDGEQFEPGRGTQYEVGVKADINDSLSATLAFFDLTRSNVVTNDPNNPGFSIQTGEQNSRGIELNFAGSILPGWNIIAGYAYTDARTTKDNSIPIDNRLNNVPEHSLSLWTTYELQKGDLKGFGFGLGLFYVGDRQGDLANTFTLPSYFRTDAAIFYKRDKFRVALNIRNLFDVKYFESAYSDLTVYPAEPLTLQGTVSWQF
jgi:iron complex outermembrane receptor protein